MKYITTLVLIFFIVSCAPSMTYEEMGDAYDIAETKEEKAEAQAVIDKFEENVRKAELFFESKYACKKSQHTAWFCSSRGITSNRKQKLENIDELVRAYKRESRDCGCATNEAIWNVIH